MALAIKLKGNPGDDTTVEPVVLAASLPSPSPVAADPEPIPQVRGHEIVNHAKYEDISRRLIMGSKAIEVAADIGMSDRNLRRVMIRPEFIEIYHKVAESFYADLDKVMKDEKIRPLLRAQAQAVRAQTLLYEIQEEVRTRIKDGTARSTDLKVGADTAFGVIDRSKNELTPDGAANIAIQLNINTDKRRLLREVTEESGVDLSDLGIIDVTPEDDDPAPKETPDGE